MGGDGVAEEEGETTGRRFVDDARRFCGGMCWWDGGDICCHRKKPTEAENARKKNPEMFLHKRREGVDGGAKGGGSGEPAEDSWGGRSAEIDCKGEDSPDSFAEIGRAEGKLGWVKDLGISLIKVSA